MEDLQERVFTNRSNQPGDDMKDEVRTDDNTHARVSGRRLESFPRLRQSGSLLKFPSACIYDQSGKNSMLSQCSFLEVNKRYQLAE